MDWIACVMFQVPFDAHKHVLTKYEIVNRSIPYIYSDYGLYLVYRFQLFLWYTKVDMNLDIISGRYSIYVQGKMKEEIFVFVRKICNSNN